MNFIIRIIIGLLLVVNMGILIGNIVLGKNIYKIYGARIVKVLAITIGLIVCFYVSLMLLGYTG